MAVALTVVIASFLLVGFHSSPIDVAIQTTSGQVKGFTVEVHEQKKVTAYLAIPYAEPPTGEHRFQPPRPLAHPRTEVLEAKETAHACFQNRDKQMAFWQRPYGANIDRPWNEDCLYLNIWVPDPVPEKAPVMVFIHGGGFVIGEATAFASHAGPLAAEEGVIVVSMNYRLGVFGFLNLGTPEAPGNMGLMDQQLALRWVQDNIAGFGGDPKQVTIFGISAGSASVGYQLLAKGSEGLFQRAIMMSGAPNNEWGFREPDRVKKAGREILKNLNYRGSPDDSISILKFLRSIDPEDINEAYDVCASLLGGISLSPSIDGTFLTDEPLNVLSLEGFNSNVSLMIGTTQDEGLFFAFMLDYELFTRYSDGSIKWSEYSDLISRIDAYKIKGWKVRALAKSYADITRKGDLHALRDAFTRLVGDYYFDCGIEEFALRYSKHNTVYRYNFEGAGLAYRQIFGSWGGAYHGEDAPLIFGVYLIQPNAAPEIKRFSKEIMKHYANFARNGNPDLGDFKADLNPEDPEWPPFEAKKRFTKILRMVNDTVVEHQVTKRCATLHVLNKISEMLKE